MSKIAQDYYKNLAGYAGGIRVTDKSGTILPFADGVDRVIDLIRANISGHKFMFIGNGGSAAISSHMSVDFWKNGGMRAVAFNDSSLLTCIGNDYGYKHVFEKPVEMFADQGDILIAISSSGRSENILLGVQAARAKGCFVITLSGFESDNPLSSLGDYNFYVPAKNFGPVEILHHSICHCILDTIMNVSHG
ncbi:MAG: SIS domain-containing protein [Nitrospirae bacterium]|nr:MAG: SIS domain-containing protein [Nitrospirota bacterium]